MPGCDPCAWSNPPAHCVCRNGGICNTGGNTGGQAFGGPKQFRFIHEVGEDTRSSLVVRNAPPLAPVGNALGHFSSHRWQAGTSLPICLLRSVLKPVHGLPSRLGFIPAAGIFSSLVGVVSMSAIFRPATDNR